MATEEDMKVVVVSIMKDEPTEFIERWAASAEDADERVLVDTGSTNEAVECARDLGVTVHEISVRPWRFDVARNAALALLDPRASVVINVDVDEVLSSGWRDALDAAGPGDRYSYHYVWNHTADGVPDISFTADKAHSRHGWIWKHPAHETLYWTGDGPSPAVVPVDMEIHHYADDTKPRAQYLPLLAQAVFEDPHDARMAHYYARELFFRGEWVRARVEFQRHLNMPEATWADERAQSYRYLAKMDDYPERWLLKAVAEAPKRREPWVDLVDLWLLWGRPEIAAGFAERALTIEPSGDYMGEAHARDDEWLRSIREV